MDCQPQSALKLSAKAILSQVVDNTAKIFYATNNNSVSLIDVDHSKILHELTGVHQARIGSIRYKDNLLITGGHDNLVKLFDTRNWQNVHTFQKIPSKFNSIDKTEHILAGATNTNIVFWDLKKMKQRSQFNESFNGEVTYIRFENQIVTNLMGCSLDGMINMFDLTQPNQEDAFNWCHKIMESPASLSTARGGRVLVQTTDHNLYKIQDGDMYGKISPNNPDSPKHILYSRFAPNSDYEKYEYYTWSPQSQQIQKWKGCFLDKNNQEKCSGYINNVYDIQILDIVLSKEGKSIAVHTDENGHVYFDRFSKQRAYKHETMNNQMESVAEKVSKMEISNGQKKQNGNQSSRVNKVNKNGYIVQKLPSSFAKHKPYRPY